MQPLFLTPVELADRWRISTNILDRWRWEGHGPAFVKPGRNILYFLEDIKRFEEERRRKACSAPSGNPSKRLPSWERLPDIACIGQKEI